MTNLKDPMEPVREAAVSALREAAERVVYVETMRRMDDSLNRDELWSPKMLHALDDLCAAVAAGGSMA